MINLYNRHGVSYSGMDIKQPEKEKNTLGAVFDAISKTTENLAKQNYALGKAEVINSVTQTAYETAPDDPKKFNELINSGFEKGLQGLDDNTKKAVLEAANDKVKLLQARVGTNLNKKLDKENSERVINLANQTLNGVGGLLDNNRQLVNALMVGDLELTDKLVKQRDENYRKLENYANATNMRGSYILGKNAAKNMRQTSEEGMISALRDEMYNMSYEELKNFDESTFQDRKRFMLKTGLSDKGYSTFEREITSRRKALSDEKKREVVDKAYFDTFHMTSDYNPETMAEIKASGALGDKYDDFEKLINETQEINSGKEKVKRQGNNALRLSEDEQMIAEFGQILPVLASTDDGSEDYKGKLLAAFSQAQRGINVIRKKNGISEERAQIIDRMLTEATTNQMFADALHYSFGEGTLAREFVENAGMPKKGVFDQFGAGGIKKAIDFISPETGKTLSYINDVLSRNREYDYLINEQTREKANKIAMETVTQMSHAINNEDYAMVQKLGEELNKELLKLKYEFAINPQEFTRLEKQLTEGKHAYFTYGNTVYEFLGFGSKDIFVEEQR